MSIENLRPRLSFQAKILIPVIALLVLLPAATAFFVHRGAMENLNHQSRQALRTADALFQNSLDLRSKQLIARYKNVVADPRFRAISKLQDGPTMKEHLNERLASEELGEEAEIALFLDERGETVAGASRNSQFRATDFQQSSQTVLEHALAGQPMSAITAVRSDIFNAVAVPVIVDEHLTGVLVVGVRIGMNVLRELTFLLRGEGVLISNGSIAASTLHMPLESRDLPSWKTGTSKASETHPVRIDNTHYLALASTFPSAAQPNAGYVLLLSQEAALQQVRQTQAALWLLCLVGIGISTAVILVVIRRITAPLRELRMHAEAVGSGDFSRKIVVRSTDEIGQLTHGFNQMTRNLRASHSELQATVETLKTTQAQLIQSEKLSAVGEFVSGIAHELNNPLTTIIGFGEMLSAANLDPKHQAYLQYIVRSTERCHKIVQGLLSFARQHPPERKLIHLSEMVDSVVELLAYEMRTSNIEVHRAIPADLPQIMGDSHQLQQVILNLLNNARQAIEANQPTGSIRITAQVISETIALQIEDNGPGISEENLAKIFHPFFTTKPVGKGTGLGLSLCYGIIREHGGTITAHSSPGKGAAFVIELPVHKTADNIEKRNSRSAGPTLNGAGKRALVIDDEEWILELVRQILNLDGFAVDVAQDGSAALEQVSGGRYELLVCDWKMPGLSGPQLFERINEINPEAANRVIFMTGDVVSESFQEFLRRHSKNCLSKPFSVNEFRETVGQFIAARN